MVYFVSAHVVDGEVLCASQICENCTKKEEYKCKPMILLDKQVYEGKAVIKEDEDNK